MPIRKGKNLKNAPESVQNEKPIPSKKEIGQKKIAPALKETKIQETRINALATQGKAKKPK